MHIEELGQHTLSVKAQDRFLEEILFYSTESQGQGRESPLVPPLSSTVFIVFAGIFFFCFWKTTSRLHLDQDTASYPWMTIKNQASSLDIAKYFRIVVATGVYSAFSAIFIHFGLFQWNILSSCHHSSFVFFTIFIITTENLPIVTYETKT